MIAGVVLGLILTGAAIALGWVASWVVPERDEWKP